MGHSARPRTIWGVDPTTQALLFALLGAVLGAGVVLAWRVSEEQQQRVADHEAPTVPPGVATVLSVLRSSALPTRALWPRIISTTWSTTLRARS